MSSLHVAMALCVVTALVLAAWAEVCIRKARSHLLRAMDHYDQAASLLRTAREFGVPSTAWACCAGGTVVRVHLVEEEAREWLRHQVGDRRWLLRQGSPDERSHGHYWVVQASSRSGLEVPVGFMPFASKQDAEDWIEMHGQLALSGGAYVREVPIGGL
jgi:hypothetical protein